MGCLVFRAHRSNQCSSAEDWVEGDMTSGGGNGNGNRRGGGGGFGGFGNFPDPFANFGMGFGGGGSRGRSIFDVFDNDPFFNDPFFTRPFGSAFGGQGLFGGPQGLLGNPFFQNQPPARPRAPAAGYIEDRPRSPPVSSLTSILIFYYFSGSISGI